MTIPILTLCEVEMLSHLRQQAAIAAGIGDYSSVKAWNNIAETAAMLRSKIAILKWLSVLAGVVACLCLRRYTGS